MLAFLVIPTSPDALHIFLTLKKQFALQERAHAAAVFRLLEEAIRTLVIQACVFTAPWRAILKSQPVASTLGMVLDFVRG